MKWDAEVLAFCSAHPEAGEFVRALAAWRPDAMAYFKIRAPGDQFSVRLDSEENPEGNYLELFWDRSLGPMMIFSRWHMTGTEAACARCEADPIPLSEKISSLLASADRLMRDELVLVIHDEGMDFRSPDHARPADLGRGDQVISWTGALDFRKE
ncbi:MAG: hypothetical protein KF767_04700 [Bdellovibrionaceae bacterium]|nr:hypothetical protein [Pseudobdellovibrionaceae bacterium]